MAHQKGLANTNELALNSVHGLAFHRGLGAPIVPTSSAGYYKYIEPETVAEFAAQAYAKPNFAIVANGADHSELSKWVGEFFTDASTTKALESPQTKYYGGEERIAHAGKNTIIIAFPGSSSYTGGFYKPEISVLASLLGGQSQIKWTSGFSLLSKASDQFPGAKVDTKSLIYSDAGLLTVTISGAAKDVSGAAAAAVKTLQEIAGGNIKSEDIQKAKARAKYLELEHGQNIFGSLELTGAGLAQSGKPYQLDETAKAIDGVSEEVVKKVSGSRHDTLRKLANMTFNAGCRGAARVQGVGFDRRRPFRTTLCGGTGSEGVDRAKDEDDGSQWLYHYLESCICGYIKDHVQFHLSDFTRDGNGDHQAMA